LPYTYSHIYDTDHISSRLWGKVAFENVFAYLNLSKESPTEQILYQIKYKNKADLAEMMGKWYGHDLKEVKKLENIDMIVPVPMFHEKEKQRGYNQAERLAAGLAQVLEKSLNSQLLVKTHATGSQTKTLSRWQRFKNTEGVFQLNKDQDLKDRHILLIDDVLTTGATLEQACKPLIQAGAKVTIVCLAVAV
jgi:ComF family protein